MKNLFTHPEKLLVHSVRNNGGNAVRRLNSPLKEAPLALLKAPGERNDINAHLVSAAPQLFVSVLTTLRYVARQSPEMAEMLFVQEMCDAVTLSHGITLTLSISGIERVLAALEIADAKAAFLHKTVSPQVTK